MVFFRGVINKKLLRTTKFERAISKDVTVLNINLQKTARARFMINVVKWKIIHKSIHEIPIKMHNGRQLNIYVHKIKS